VVANLTVGMTINAFTNLTTPFAPQNPFAPWGVSPQAKRLRSLYLTTNLYPIPRIEIISTPLSSAR